MKIFDLHQDLMAHVRFKEIWGQNEQTSFEAIKKSALDLVVATAFPVPPNDDQLHESAPELITEELELYQNFIAANDGWKLVKTVADLSVSEKKLLLHIEGLNLFDGSDATWAQFKHWIELGVRSVGTHWNLNNQLGGGTLDPTAPLTALGAELIAYLEVKNLVFDMAHMGRHTFIDAAKIARRPLYVSHGNADAVCQNIRNYTDDQLRLIAQSDGVIGVFFPNTFTVGKKKQGNVADVVSHIDYLKKTIGVRHIALGSDFGGIVTGSLTQLAHVNDFPNLLQRLAQSGYSETEIEQIAQGNARRILTAHLGD